MGVKRSTVHAWAWASLVANTVIILTGGLVRLTGSGLGCSTWPKCTSNSFTPHGAASYHQFIEFGNRTLTFALVAVAIGTFIAVWRYSASTKRMRALALTLGLGIPLQAVIGGVSVLVDLNPWVVSLHFLLSAALVVTATWLLILVRDPGTHVVASLDYWLTRAAFGVLLVVVYLGTVVTGSGPFAGDANAPRNNLDPEMLSRIHALAVWLLVAITVVLVVRSRKSGLVGSAVALLLVELAQGVIGYIQYFTGLPAAVVAVHLVGSAVVLAVATRVVLVTRRAEIHQSEPLASTTH